MDYVHPARGNVKKNTRSLSTKIRCHFCLNIALAFDQHHERILDMQVMVIGCVFSIQLDIIFKISPHITYQ